MSPYSLGYGPPTQTQSSGQTKRYVSPSKKDIYITPDFQKIIAARKRKLADVLTPANADAVLRTSLNISQFSGLLAADENLLLDKDALFTALASCVIDKTVIPFTSVSNLHMQALGMDVVDILQFDPRLEAAAQNPQSAGNLALSRVAVESVKNHFSISNESGCRCVIDNFLLAAVIYAQGFIDNDKALKDTIRSQYKVRDPHIAVFTELQIPPTTVTSGDRSYTFHGYLDYGVGFIETMDKPSLRHSTLQLPASEALSGVVEVKSMNELDYAMPQIVVQALTVLSMTDKETFTGILTNGAYWRIFVVHKVSSTNQLRIFRSRELVATDDSGDSGLIVELLKDMILYSASAIIETDLNVFSPY